MARGHVRPSWPRPARHKRTKSRDGACGPIRGRPGSDTFIVSCGYAVHRAWLPPDDATSPRLVRLSDGWSWPLHDQTAWGWGIPVALTCEELFLSIGTKVVRVRIDSLGPGEPPDRAMPHPFRRKRLGIRIAIAALASAHAVFCAS